MGESEFPRPLVTVDIVLLTLRDEALHVALLPRPAAPHEGEVALIGGYIHTDKDADADAAVRRILKDKAGLSGIFFEQLKTFASSTRDPRDWSVSIAYVALVSPDMLESAGTRLELRPVASPGTLPFDHAEIIAAALGRLRGKGAYSTIPAQLLPKVFTMSELQGIYETVIGERLDQSAFRRKINDLNLLEEVPGEKRQTERARRPTTLYRLKSPVAIFDRRI